MMRNRHMPPENYPPLGQHDEDLIRQGIAKAETESFISSTSSHREQDLEDANHPIDESTFVSTRMFYILRHTLFSKEVGIIDITGQTRIFYTGGEISDDLRDAARSLTEDKARSSNPLYKLNRKHFYSRTLTMTSLASPGRELATWKHGGTSFSKAEIKFPHVSPYGPQDFIMKPVKWYRRTNEWVQNGVTYTWRHNSKFKANRMTLLKKFGDRQIVVARYAQRWGSWITGGILLVDTKEVDEVVTVLTACVMLKRMQQRAAERTRSCSGGGGGG